MPRISRYGKPCAVRFKKAIDRELSTYCINHPEISKSDVIQEAVECFLSNPKCLAHRRLK